MKIFRPWILFIILAMPFQKAHPQSVSNTDNSFLPYKKQYFASELELLSFSSAVIGHPTSSQELGTLRFSGFLNYGYYYHRNVTHRMGFYTGLSVKNVGFIHQMNWGDSIVKHRTYSINIPIRLKFGNMGANQYFFIGGDIGIPIQYKEKSFVKGNRYDKIKINEWFQTDGRANILQPSITIGYQKGMSYIRLYYYPMNLFNTDYKDPNGALPYQDYEANIFGVAMGIHLSNRPLYD